MTSGGNGCTQLRFALGLGAGAAAGVTTRRGRTGGGGARSGGAPSASRKRRIRSSSLCAGGRDGAACSLGEGDSGFLESSGALPGEPLKKKRESAKDEKDERIVHARPVIPREARDLASNVIRCCAEKRRMPLARSFDSAATPLRMTIPFIAIHRSPFRAHR